MDLSPPRSSSPAPGAPDAASGRVAAPVAAPRGDSRAVVRCMVAGVVLGAVAGLLVRQPALLCAFVGGVAGALVGWAMAGLERDRGTP